MAESGRGAPGKGEIRIRQGLTGNDSWRKQFLNRIWRRKDSWDNGVGGAWEEGVCC